VIAPPRGFTPIRPGVRRVVHHGKQFHVDAACPLWEPSPQRTPVSISGRIVGPRPHLRRPPCANVCFVNGSTRAETSGAYRQRPANPGPRRGRCWPLSVQPVVTGPHRGRSAPTGLEDYRRCASVEGALAHGAASLGIDFGRYGLGRADRCRGQPGDYGPMSRRLPPRWAPAGPSAC